MVRRARQARGETGGRGGEEKRQGRKKGGNIKKCREI